MGNSRSPRKKHKRPIFVVQEHHARALHWDFRLEHDGVLASWALPKGVPEDPKRNRLAVQTEDHPMDYAEFAGEIPGGEYGGGHVTLWDHGEFDLEKWSDREVMVVLHGDRVRGRYVLFRTDAKNWMIHRMDPPDRDLDPLPDTIAPMLATPGELPRRDDGWAYEFKWDGIRAVVRVDGGRVRVRSRGDKDITSAFPELRELGERLGSRAAVIDGEIVAFDDAGRPSFERLQRRLNLVTDTAVRAAAASVAATFLMFDVLYLDGRSMLSAPYDERREALESLAIDGGAVVTTPAFRSARGRDVLDAAERAGLEGVVAKRRSSRYEPGRRASSWVKVKLVRTQEVVIAGWTEGNNSLAGSLGALLLGVYDDGELVYAGKVGSGFDTAGRRRLLEQLEPLATERSPFAKPLPSDLRAAHFVEPSLVGEVTFTEWTRAGQLRHPVWRGLRVDKLPREVVR
jgi:bifunctional non-homologous end joining protein LigD